MTKAESHGADKRTSLPGAFRCLIVFQIKLAADALRDLLLSPVSVVVFIVDAVRRPNVEDSLHAKLMRTGRRSDRVINLFNEHNSEAGHPTIDSAIDELAKTVRQRPDQSQ